MVPRRGAQSEPFLSLNDIDAISRRRVAAGNAMLIRGRSLLGERLRLANILAHGRSARSSDRRSAGR